MWWASRICQSTCELPSPDPFSASLLEMLLIAHTADPQLSDAEYARVTSVIL